MTEAHGNPQPPFRTHVCLVSGEAAANLLPVLDPAFRPREAVLIESPQMRQHGKWLGEAMSANGIARVRHVPIKDAYDITGIERELEEFLGREPEHTAIALNVTGGTKPLAIAAQQVFSRSGIAVFYLERERSEVSFIGGGAPKRVLKARLKLEDYFLAHGHTVARLERARPPVADVELARELVKEISSLGKAIPLLNMCASSAEQKPGFCSDSLKPGQRSPHFERLVMLLETAGHVKWEGTDRLRFKDEEARAFANGGWLDFYVHDEFLALQQRNRAGDGARNVRVVQADGTRNELDLALFARNRLHVVECKTRGFTSKAASDEARKALFQLDSLSSLGGLNTRALFVSYLPLNETILQRAKGMRIRTVVGPDLGKLSSEMEKWTAQPY